MAEVIITDANYQQFIDHTDPVTGDKKSKGLIPRDFERYPQGYMAYARSFDLPLIPESDWQPLLDKQIAEKRQLSYVRNTMGPNGGPIPSRDQNGKGYCWAHSGVSAMLCARAKAGEPYADLSAYMVACIIKNYRDEGGWGSEGVEWVAQNGVPTSEFWPQQSMSRSNDTPAMRANAAAHKWTEWRDLAESGNLVKQQLVTCLLLGYPVVVDYNWWSHSVMALDLVSINPFRIRIWNSWGDSWSENGTGILEENKAIPNGALVCLVTTPSMQGQRHIWSGMTADEKIEALNARLSRIEMAL